MGHFQFFLLVALIAIIVITTIAMMVTELQKKKDLQIELSLRVIRQVLIFGTRRLDRMSVLQYGNQRNFHSEFLV